MHGKAMLSQKQNPGFAFIALLLALVIAAILFTMYFSGSGSSGKSMQQTGQKAIEQTKENNASQIQQHLEIQNELNSIDG